MAAFSLLAIVFCGILPMSPGTGGIINRIAFSMPRASFDYYDAMPSDPVVL